MIDKHLVRDKHPTDTVHFYPFRKTHFIPCPLCRRLKQIQVCASYPVVCNNKAYTRSGYGTWFELTTRRGYYHHIKIIKQLHKLGLGKKITASKL